ncbi:Mu transposase C-terminal domain-containing protein [Streptomyces sp. NPDC006529]|uniref:Mu transposase C-terminal domain-containing protein n=1 Tax=Streptomyces sp. NPDC006529 TaxID=3157177 RepID=UPI0033ABF038
MFSPALGRAAAVPRLLDLDGRGELTPAHVRLVAMAVGRSERTVWRWLATARSEGRTGRKVSTRFVVTAEIRRLLAFYGGNASRLHEELVRRAAESQDSGPVPSLSTLHRALRRDLTRGERAGLRSGEAARRAHDVFGKRPPSHRNAAWEGDHKHLPVEVDLEGELVTPWVTWFIDCAHNVITGASVTAHAPSRDGVLAALRVALVRDEAVFGPVGGLPGKVRVDRGKEFLCEAVTGALGAFAVVDLPAGTPHLKGSIEALNDAVEEMFLVTLPRYRHRQRLAGGRLADPDAPPLAFDAFVAALLEWVHWWNTSHRSPALGGRTPLQAWQADPTPVTDVSKEALIGFGLEGDGRIRLISTSGVRFRRRDYIADWMVGCAGDPVTVRRLPHHDEEIELFEPVSGRHLGRAFLADAADLEQFTAVRSARTSAARQLRADLKAAEKLRRKRFEAVTTAKVPKQLNTLTAEEAEAELRAADQRGLRELARPDYIPHAPVPDTWARPIPPTPRTPPPGKDHEENHAS